MWEEPCGRSLQEADSLLHTFWFILSHGYGDEAGGVQSGAATAPPYIDIHIYKYTYIYKYRYTYIYINIDINIYTYI